MKSRAVAIVLCASFVDGIIELAQNARMDTIHGAFSLPETPRRQPPNPFSPWLKHPIFRLEHCCSSPSISSQSRHFL
jgi:hypothetical protein